ncbi:hypothetical protein K435DRAFT_804993 [Dendrothele bispora CBS 962.96]|uniref:Uncharacterized protein n=1 Tax=Dendrothele bispora (strain CBS 962.96) TaxID=1314807 RepID=A0A4S8LCF5_DENBC|nr:hypothetical protein K435DRAFT_804993 [Dendrothele bispora CBS 962.96]
MAKRRPITVLGFDIPPVASSMYFSLSKDGRRLRQKRVHYTEADLSSELSSEAEYSTDHRSDKEADEESDEGESQGSFRDLYQPIDFEDHEQYMAEGFSYRWGTDNAVSMDQELQELSEAQDPSAAFVKVTRPSNLHSDNPSLAWTPYREDYLREMLFLEGRRGMGSESDSASSQDSSALSVEGSPSPYHVPNQETPTEVPGPELPQPENPHFPEDDDEKRT